MITADGTYEMDVVLFTDDDHCESFGPESGSDSSEEDGVKPAETTETHETFVMTDSGCGKSLAGTAAQQEFVTTPCLEFVHPDDAALLHQ